MTIESGKNLSEARLESGNQQTTWVICLSLEPAKVPKCDWDFADVFLGEGFGHVSTSLLTKYVELHVQRDCVILIISLISQSFSLVRVKVGVDLFVGKDGLDGH